MAHANRHQKPKTSEKVPKTSKNTFSKSSGDADELFCDPCLHGGKYVAVDGYCQICEEYMCSNCIEVHRNQKLSRSHAISNKSEMPKKSNFHMKVSQDICKDVCCFHHPEIIRFYCKTHDETGCVDCMTLNHATCTKERIQDIADGSQATKEFKVLHQKLDTFHNKLRSMQNSLSKNELTIGATFESIQQKIESFREEINAYLDEIQKELTDEVAAFQKVEEAPLKQLSIENEILKADVESIIQSLQNEDNINSSFVLAKQTPKRLIALQEQFNNIEQKQKQQQAKQLTFHPSPDLVKILSSKEPLGTLIRTTDVSSITASYQRSINMKSSKDCDCFINDCILLGPNRMVVTDDANKKVKLIDIEHNKILFSYRTNTSPGGLTAISTDQVAVALPVEGSILILNVASILTRCYDIKLQGSDKDCWVIDYKNGMYAVGYLTARKVDILDTRGKVLYALQPKDGNKDLLPSVRGIKFGIDVGTLIVSDADTNKICVVSFEGKILHMYTHDSLVGPCRMGVTKEGILFVGNYEKGSIHAVDKDLTTGQVIIENSQMLGKPVLCTYCDTSRRLYIANKYCVHNNDYRNNALHVFQLKNI